MQSEEESGMENGILRRGESLSHCNPLGYNSAKPPSPINSFAPGPCGVLRSGTINHYEVIPWD